jgi:hypothetical protein
METLNGNLEFGVGWPRATEITGPRETDTFMLPAGAPQALFALEKSTCPALNLTLVAPNGITTYTPGALPIGASYYNHNGAQVYRVLNPAGGAWQAVVSGGTTSTTCAIEVRYQDAPPTFSSFSAVNAGNDVQITWTSTDPENTGTVTLYYDSDASGYDGVPFESGLPLSSGLLWEGVGASNGNYFLYARIDDGQNLPAFSAYSATVTVTRAGIPSIPANPNATADASSILLTWDANPQPDITTYEIEATYSGNPGFTQAYSTVGTAAILSRPDALQTVSLRLRALDVSGNASTFTGWLDVLPGQSDDLTPPDAPSGLTAGVNGGQISLNWNATPEAASYRVWYDFGAGNTFTASGAAEGESPFSVATSTATLSNLPAPALVRVVISALDASGNQSEVSALVEVMLPGVGASQSLLTNGDFELKGATGKLAEGWKFSNAQKAKRLCNPAKASIYQGLCALRITALADTTVQAVQKFDLTGAQAGQSLWLTGWIEGIKLSRPAEIMLKVKYLDGTRGKRIVSVLSDSFRYTLAENLFSLASDGKNGKLSIRQRSTAGKLFADGLTLMLTGQPAARSLSATEAISPLPAPTAPEGFRGSN